MAILDKAPAGDNAVIGHGAVGMLLWCALAGKPIGRRYDQRSSGNYFRVDRRERAVLGAWEPIAPPEP